MMNPEVKDAVLTAVPRTVLALAGTSATWWLDTASKVVAITVGLLTIVYIVHQIVKIRAEIVEQKRRSTEAKT